MNDLHSRRNILKFTAAGSAAILPAMALAAPDPFLVDPVQLSDREQLDACMAHMEAILARMHPNVTHQSMRYDSRQDGTYRVWVHSERAFLPWTGPGLYRVSMDGYLSDFWIEKVQRRNVNGVVYRVDFDAWQWLDYGARYLHEARMMIVPAIVARLDGQPPAWCVPHERDG